MQCCGDPMEVGRDVAWKLSPEVDTDFLGAVLGRDLAAAITHAYDHHGDDDRAVKTPGTVRSIRAAFCDFARRPGVEGNTLHPVEGTGLCDYRISAGGWEPGPTHGQFVGYVVELIANEPAA
jgi:hypothetical protein